MAFADVGKVGSFGMSGADAARQIAQIMLDSRNGSHPLQVSGGGGGGATIPATTNLIKGDGAGNGADSGIVPDSVVQGTTGVVAGAVLVATGSGNNAQASALLVDVANSFVFIPTGYSFSNNSQWVIGNNGTVNGIGDFVSFASFRSGISSGISDAATNTVVTGLTLTHATSATAAAGLGVAEVFQLPSDVGTLRTAGQVSAVWVSAADGAETSNLNLQSITSVRARNIANSSFVTLQGKLTTDTNATTGLIAGALSALTTASITITDATGQVYRVPCVV